MPLNNRDLDQFFANAQTKLPGVSVAGMKLEMFDVLKEFFEDSNCWKEDIQFQAVADTFLYDLVPDEGQIIRLLAVWDDKMLPIPAFMPDFGTVRLTHPINTTPPDRWTARTVNTVVLPSSAQDVPLAPAWTLRVYSIHVMDGLLGKMMSQQGKSYTNPTMATYHLRRFRAGIQIARAAADAQNTVGAQAWAYPRTASIGSQRGGVSTAWPSQMF